MALSELIRFQGRVEKFQAKRAFPYVQKYTSHVDSVESVDIQNAILVSVVTVELKRLLKNPISRCRIELLTIWRDPRVTKLAILN